MSVRSIILTALLAAAEARFGQENPPAIQEVAAINGGSPGEAATIAGGLISDLLAAANPCKKLQDGDNIIAKLGNGADAVKAAQDFVHAEQNFNPFNSPIPSLCSDPTLPATAELRGILPLIDPGVIGSDVANKVADASLTTPLDATGKSIADLFLEQGFSNFTTKDAAGTAGIPSGSAGFHDRGCPSAGMGFWLIGERRWLSVFEISRFEGAM